MSILATTETLLCSLLPSDLALCVVDQLQSRCFVCHAPRIETSIHFRNKKKALHECILCGETYHWICHGRRSPSWASWYHVCVTCVSQAFECELCQRIFYKQDLHKH